MVVSASSRCLASSEICIPWSVFVFRSDLRAFRDDVRLQSGVRCRDVGRFETEFLADDIAPLSKGGGFEEGDVPIASLASETTVAGHDELFRIDMFKSSPNPSGDIFGGIYLQATVADGTHADFLGQAALHRSEQIDFPETAVGHLDGPDIALASIQVQLEGLAVTVVFDHSLHVRIAPAGVNPEFDVVEAFDLPIERFDHEFDFFAISTVGVGPEVQRGFLYLDAFAASIAQGEEFLVHGLGHVPDDLPSVLVFVGVNIEEQSHHLGAAGSEADGFLGLGLSDAPNFRVVEGAVLDLVDDVWPSPTGIDFVEQGARWISQPW